MLRLALLLILVPAARAQPGLPPADSVRIESLLDGLELERRAATSLARLSADPGMAGAIDRLLPDAFRHAVRARLAAGYTTARADSLDAAITDGRYHALVEQVLRLESPDAAARLVDVMVSPPKKGVLGDSATAVRFVRASGLVEYTRATMHDLFETLVARVPILAEEMASSGMTVGETVDQQVGEMEPVFVLSFRTAPPDEQMRPATLSFAESDAGRYASVAVLDGMRDAFVPALTEALAASLDIRMTDPETLDAFMGDDERPVRTKPKPTSGVPNGDF